MDSVIKEEHNPSQSNDLSASIMKNLQICKVENDFRSSINSIHFNRSGSQILVSDDVSIRIYDAGTGKRLKMLYNKVN